VWQAGSFKNESLARLDVTHYGRLSRTQLDQIEDHANEIVTQNRNIEITVIPRAEADSTHGFSIYQGGPPKHDMIRLVNIEGHDLQACGGTHVSKTSEIGEIRIVRSSQVQDGVERLVVMAGEAAREHARVQSKLLSESADILGVQPHDLPQAVDRFFNEWKDQRKTIEQLRGEIARIRAGGESSAITKDGIRYVIMEMDGEVKELMGTLGELTRDPSKPTVAVLASREGGGRLVVAITEDSIASEKHDASKIIQAISPAISGSGGGRPTMAQAGGTDPSGIDNALKMARSELDI
jgi:alanyl-tRNA synthetase